MVKSSLGLVALLAMAAPVQDSTRFEWKPKVGEEVKWKMSFNMVMDMGGQDGSIEASFLTSSKIKSIEGDKVTTEGSMSDFTLKFNGQEMDMGGQGPGEGMVTTTVMTLDGKVIKSDAPEEMGGERMQRMNAFHRPTKDIKIGESWEASWPAVKEKGLQSAKAKWTLRASEKRGAVDCWVVDFVFSEMDNTSGMGATGSMYLNKADGYPEYLKYKFTNASFSPEMPPTNGEGTMSRVR
jgi:hypothetical protein